LHAFSMKDRGPKKKDSLGLGVYLHALSGCRDLNSGPHGPEVSLLFRLLRGAWIPIKYIHVFLLEQLRGDILSPFLAVNKNSIDFLFHFGLVFPRSQTNALHVGCRRGRSCGQRARQGALLIPSTSGEQRGFPNFRRFYPGAWAKAIISSMVI
jgi:hypothetical protein